MSSLEEFSQDQESASRREDVIAAVGSLGHGDNVSSIVSERLEQRDQHLRHRDRDRPTDRFQRQADRSSSIRTAARQAIREEVHKAAQRQDTLAKPDPRTAGQSIQAGPPPTWDRNAKGEWATLPESVKIAEYRAQAALEPRLREYADISKSLDHLRPVLQKHGLNDVQAVQKLVEWEGALRNPATRDQAFAALQQAYGVNPTSGYGYQQSDPHVAAAVESELGKFAQGRPHFENVRVGMGTLIANNPQHYVNADGTVNLDRAYADACRHLGFASTGQAPRKSLPRTETMKPNGSTGSVRGDLIRALKQTTAA